MRRTLYFALLIAGNVWAQTYDTNTLCGAFLTPLGLDARRNLRLLKETKVTKDWMIAMRRIAESLKVDSNILSAKLGGFRDIEGCADTNKIVRRSEKLARQIKILNDFPCNNVVNS